MSNADSEVTAVNAENSNDIPDSQRRVAPQNPSRREPHRSTPLSSLDNRNMGRRVYPQNRPARGQVINTSLSSPENQDTTRRALPLNPPARELLVNTPSTSTGNPDSSVPVVLDQSMPSTSRVVLNTQYSVPVRSDTFRNSHSSSTTRSRENYARSIRMNRVRKRSQATRSCNTSQYSDRSQNPVDALIDLVNT